MTIWTTRVYNLKQQRLYACMRGIFYRIYLFFVLEKESNEMNELVRQEKIENMIYEIRGVQVMLDSDVAMLFGYETKYLNRQV